MGEHTTIAWCHHTFNMVEGCAKVSAGCEHCYAWKRDRRLHRGKHWGQGAERKTMSAAYWKQPHKWNRLALLDEERPRVFCSSLADVFEDHPTNNAERSRLWELIRSTPNLDWLLLSKRPENFACFLPDDWGEGYANVWLGVTAEDQENADRRIPILTRTPARVRFISAEPLLERVTFGRLLAGIDWVIVGGESESAENARACEPEWMRAIIAECRGAGVAPFMKQLGTVLARRWGCRHPKGEDPLEWPADLRVREMPR